MSGNGGGATGLFENPLNEYKGCVTGAAVVSFVPNDVKNRGFYGGARMTSRGQQSPIQYGLGGPHGAPSWGADYKKALIEQANRKLTMTNFVSSLPVATNRVDLDPDVKDPWGLPAMRITMIAHPNDFKSIQFFNDRAVEVLKAAGAKDHHPRRGARLARRRPQPRLLPHGQRSQDLRGQQVSPRPRRAERLLHRRELLRHRRAQPPDDDDLGDLLPRGRPPGEGGQGGRC